jgi:signal transduction histidine kinase
LVEAEADMLTLKAVSKQYGQRDIFDQISLTITPDEIVGMVDHESQAIFELVKMLSGQGKPDSGQVLVNQRPLTGYFRPQQHQIGIIHREPRLVGSLDIASNIYLGQEPRQRHPLLHWLRMMDPYRLSREAEQLVASLNFTLPNVQTRVHNLSTEQQQLVAIAQLIVQDPQIIVIDHPGRTLSLPYREQLFDQIRAWHQQRKIVIIGTTDLDHLFAVCSRIVVLRNGKIVIDAPTQELNRETVIAALLSERNIGQVPPVLWAMDSYYQAIRQAQLLRHQQQLLEQDLAQQNSIRLALLEQLSAQVSALDNANLALQDAQRRLLTEREDERKHLARELHDQIIQDLLTCNYQLEELGEAHPQLDRDINAVRDSVRTMVEDLRRICGRLRPPTIDSFGLGATLQSYTKSWGERHGIQVQLQLDDKIGRLTEELELSLFRIIQESLNNTAKHAHASVVSVSLKLLNPRMLQLLISDNGTGFVEAFDLGQLSNAGHFGILGITERVALFGGRITFRNQVKGGLQIEVELPHKVDVDHPWYQLKRA